MKGCFIASFKRAFLSKRYLISIIATVILCFLFSKEILSPTDKNSVYYIDLLINYGQFKKILVLFSAVPFVTFYCEDFNSGYIKSIIVRSGERKYIISNVITAALSGFSAVFNGMVIYFCIISVYHAPEPYINYGYYQDIACNHPIAFALIEICNFSLYSTMWTIGGLAMSSIIIDKFIAIGTPLIFGYVLEELTFKWPRYINLYSLSHLSGYFNINPYFDWLYPLIVFLVIITLFGHVFSYFVKRRSRNEMD